MSDPNLGDIDPLLNPDGTPKEPVVKDKDKVGPQFDVDQTRWVNGFADEMYAKGRAKAEKEAKAEWEAKLTTATAETVKLRDQVDKLKVVVPPVVVDDKDTKSVDAIAQLTAKVAEMQTSMTTLAQAKVAAEAKVVALGAQSTQTQIKEAFIEAAKMIEFFDPMEVFSMIKDHLSVDAEQGGEVVVLNPKTNLPRSTITDQGTMRSVTLGEYLTEFAANKHYLVKARNPGGGSGSGESKPGAVTKPGQLPDFNTMTPAEFEAYKNNVKTR